MSLENNDNRFALLGLPAADVAIMLRSGGMRVGARLGNISLKDLSASKVADGEFKNLLTIEGEELADFSYETFDPTDEETFPGYNSSVNLRAGSLKFTFMEQAVRDLSAFALKFARMKAIYDAASYAAVQRASEVTRMHYDIVVKTPIVILPRDGLVSQDRLILRLGEIVAKNEYLGDANDTSTIAASLSGVNVASEIHIDSQRSNVQMIDDVSITANVKQAGGSENRSDPNLADTEVTTEMSDVNLFLTQRQYMLLMAVLDALPKALVGEDDDAVNIQSRSITPNLSEPPTPGQETPTESLVNLEPELVVIKQDPSQSSTVWAKLMVAFSVNTVALELYTLDAILEEDLKQNSIARFALNKVHAGFKQLSDSAMEAEFSLRTLSFLNTRVGNSVFREIVPAAKNDGNQV